MNLASLLIDEVARRARGARRIVVAARVILGCVVSLLGGTCLVGAAPISADDGSQDVSTEPVYSVEIPASNAAEALNRLAEQTGAIMLFPYDIAESRRANAVTGRYTLTQALNALLNGSGLTGGLSDKRVIQISVTETNDNNSGGEAMKVARKTGFMAILASVFAGSAQAQDVGTDTSDFDEPDRIEEIVVSAQRRETQLQRIPSSITILSFEELEPQFTVSPDVNKTLAQLVPGTQMPNFSAQTGLQGFAIRGRPSLTQVNGIPLNSLFFSSGVDLQHFDAESIGRIEVLRGASAQYGFGSTGGLINVMTKRPTGASGLSFTSKLGTRFSEEDISESGGFLLYQDVMGGYERGSFRVGVSYRELGTRFDGDGDIVPDDFARDNNDFLMVDFLGDYEIADSQRLEIAGFYFEQDFEKIYRTVTDEADSCQPAFASPTGEPIKCRGELLPDIVAWPSCCGQPIPGVPLGPPGSDITAISGTYFADELPFGDLQAQVFFMDNNFTFTGFSFELEPDVWFGSIFNQNEDRLGVRLSASTPIGSDGGRVVYGYDFLEYSMIALDNWAIDGPPVTVTPSVGEIEQRSNSVYAQVEWPIGTVTLNGGIRYDDVEATLDSYEDAFGFAFTGGEVSYDNVSGNLGFTWQLTEPLTLYAGWSQGFDVVDLGRATFTVPSADLIKPEVADVDQYEVGARYRSDRFSLEFAGFFTESALSNRVSPILNPDGTIVQGPGAGAAPFRQPEEIWGIEIAASGRIADQITVGGNFTWQDGEVEEDGVTRPLDSARVTPVRLTAYVDYSAAWFNSQFQVTVVDDRDEFGPSSDAFPLGDVEGYTLADLVLGADFDQWQLQLGVENLFDEQYIPVFRQAGNFVGAQVAGYGRTISMHAVLSW